MVGGSGSIAHSFQQYRELGAKTRAMLVAAAADRWNTTPDQCRTEASVVHGPGGRSATYAELASDAARKPVPATVRLKNPTEFRLVGKKVKRLDSSAKCNGSLKFGLDLDLPGMKVAVVAHPPVFGARVKRSSTMKHDESKACAKCSRSRSQKGRASPSSRTSFGRQSKRETGSRSNGTSTGVEAADSCRVMDQVQAARPHSRATLP